MARERRLLGRQVDADCAAGHVIDEHCLGEPELDGHGLPALGLNCGTIEEDPERIASTAARTHEDAKDMERRHPTSGRGLADLEP